MIFVKIGRGYVENISQYVFFSNTYQYKKPVPPIRQMIPAFTFPSNFLQTTSAAYGYYPFLLSSIHHMVLGPCGSEVRHLFSHHFPEFPFASCGTDDTCTTGYVQVHQKFHLFLAQSGSIHTPSVYLHHMYPYLMIIGCTDIGISRKSIRTALRSV